MIASTVEIGFTRQMAKKYKKHIIFQPEYYGMTKHHPYKRFKHLSWVTLGGNKQDTAILRSIYRKKFKSIKIYQCGYELAEMSKYLTNTFLATKVIFCNEMYDLAKKFKINWHQLLNIWLADPRIGASHTDVYKSDRGYGGMCFPKDVKALIHTMQENGLSSEILLAANNKNNKYHR